VNRKVVRLRDVALVAGTSTKTASRVVNGDERVSPDTRRRVEHAVESLGYQVDVTARSLRRGVDDTIGIVVPTLGDPFFAKAIEEIEKRSLDLGVKLLVASNSHSAETEREIVEGLIGRRVAGLIVTPEFADYSFLKRIPTPVVFIDRHPRGLDSGAVRVDDQGAARTAVLHLAEHGHRRIAIVTDDLTIRTSNLRYRGYHDALRERGLPIEDRLEASGCHDAHDAFEATATLINGPHAPTAIFSSRSETSLGVVRQLHASGRTDIALISFGDFATADVLTPPVTSIDHDPAMLASAAMDRLTERMAGLPDDGSDTIVPLRLIERGSGEMTPAHLEASA
jgi:LacI family transcriptional regulator